MSKRYICDFPECGKEATVRIIERRYNDPDFKGSLDACDEHRTITHPGWWCRESITYYSGTWSGGTSAIPLLKPDNLA